ncbi:MAG: ribosome maturation factor RimP [Actinomycetaceae bacterium]|nr:ribosome maturation factor RimP [Actinomycetaceae bacterium]
MARTPEDGREDLTARITQLLQPAILEAGLFLEEVRVVGPASRPVVRVFVDLVDGQDLLGEDDLDVASRAVSTVLDTADPIETAYDLEVSSPGAERLLKTHRHFVRTLGRTIELTLETGETLKGRLDEVGDAGFTIFAGTEARPVEFGQIKRAQAVVVF